jgi:hypothetical protein
MNEHGGQTVIAFGARQFARIANGLNHDSGRRRPAPTRTVYGITALIAVLLLAVLLFLWSHRGIARASADGTRVGSAEALGSRATSGEAPASNGARR